MSDVTVWGLLCYGGVVNAAVTVNGIACLSFQGGDDERPIVWLIGCAT